MPIAEDELDPAEALTVFFEKNHFSADAVNDGFSAYEYGSSGEYDGIIGKRRSFSRFSCRCKAAHLPWR